MTKPAYVLKIAPGYAVGFMRWEVFIHVRRTLWSLQFWPEFDLAKVTV